MRPSRLGRLPRAGRLRRRFDVAREITQCDRVNALGFCVGGTLLAAALAVLAAKGEDAVESVTYLATMLDFEAPGQIGVFIDESAHRGARGGDRQGRHPAGRGTRLDVQRAARQRPGLALRGQQLPDGRRAGGLRPALLERRQHQPAGPDVLQLRAQHLPREQAARAGRAAATAACRWTWARWTGRRSSSRRARTTSCPGARPTARSALLGGEKQIRARRERPHRGRDQSGGGQQAQLLDVGKPVRQDPDDWLAQAQEERGSWWPQWSQWLEAVQGRRRAKRRRRPAARNIRRSSLHPVAM